jgi:hypothetical protein
MIFKKIVKFYLERQMPCIPDMQWESLRAVSYHSYTFVEISKDRRELRITHTLVKECVCVVVCLNMCSHVHSAFL